jgi:hypothetical protein
MPTLRMFLQTAAVLISICSTRPLQEAVPTLSKDPLTADQIAIYRTFLENYAGAPAPVHVANRTDALVDAESDDDSDDTGVPQCLKRLKIVFDKDATGSAHMLDPSLAIPGRFVLVDPDLQAASVKENDPSKTMRAGKTSEDAVNQAFSTGLLSFSEIAFDKKHHVAAMSFSFWCGRSCGHGAIVVFKKKSGQWKISKKPCVEWIS